MKFVFTFLAVLGLAGSVRAQDSVQQRVNIHFQTTYIYQYKPAFNAAYSGPNSLQTGEEKQNSITATLFAGVRLWHGAELYVNPEVAGGSGLSGAFGMAASTNGETFRVGAPAPTIYVARAFLKQTIVLGKENSGHNDDGQNQLAGNEPSRFLRLFAGKFSLGDFFDNNTCAASPRTQFLNWALMSNAAWDYAANLRGYTAGGVVMLQIDNMAYKVGVATEPVVANGEALNRNFGMARGINAEVDRVYAVRKMRGHLRVLGYMNETNMGSYSQAMHTLDSNGRPDVIMTEKNGRRKTGIGVNVDQQVNDNLSVFARLGWNDGKTETWAFTEADRTISAGLILSGARWKRKDDNIGIAAVVNGLSADHKDYLAAGGLGFQLGDGKLSYANESVLELFYNWKPLASGLWMSGDYQFAINPGYNSDRGPVNVFSFRLHVEL